MVFLLRLHIIFDLPFANVNMPKRFLALKQRPDVMLLAYIAFFYLLLTTPPNISH